MSDWREERRRQDRTRREEVMRLPVLQVRRHGVLDGQDGDLRVCASVGPAGEAVAVWTTAEDLAAVTSRTISAGGASFPDPGAARPVAARITVHADAGIRRVVIAVIDPTSRGEGGVAELRRASVDVETGVLADEARTVLGDWLAGLQNRRPVITWPYLITGRGIEALPTDTSEARQLRLNADAVLKADGSVQEAVPGSHGKGILALRDPAGINVAEAAAALYDGGVRRLLLDGGLDAAKPFLDSGLVDRVTAYLAHENASRRPAAELPWPLPPGFVITCAARAGSFVRVEGQQDALR